MFVARVQGSAVAGEKDWIAVTDDGDAPAWSPDATFCISGPIATALPCLWAQRLDPSTKRPIGTPLSIQHFHSRGLSWPMRYFLAKRHEGPALFVADRIDTLQRALEPTGSDGQFHPSYTRMVPAHHVVELALVGCPDPDPTTRASSRRARDAAADLDEIGRATSARWPTRSRSGCACVERERRARRSA